MLLIGKLDKNPFNLDPFYIWLKRFWSWLHLSVLSCDYITAVFQLIWDVSVNKFNTNSWISMFEFYKTNIRDAKNIEFIMAISRQTDNKLWKTPTQKPILFSCKTKIKVPTTIMFCAYKMSKYIRYIV